MLDDEIFPNYEQLQIVEKLVKTCYMDGLTDDCVNEVIMKLTDDSWINYEPRSLKEIAENYQNIK